MKEMVFGESQGESIDSYLAKSKQIEKYHVGVLLAELGMSVSGENAWNMTICVSVFEKSSLHFLPSG